MSSVPEVLARLALVLCACLSAGAQVTQQTSAPSIPDAAHLEQVPRVPGVGTIFRGLNAGITFSGVHDSVIGWYNVVTPAIGYTFSKHYSADASVSVYPYRLVQKQLPTVPPTFQLVTDLGDKGDTLIGVHASFGTGLFRSTTTAYLSAPTGDQAVGLGTGKVTFDFSDHLERYIHKTAIIVDIGAGNSSGLYNSLVTRSYSSVGDLAHFQEGIVFWVLGRNYIQSVAYEQVPFGTQTVFTTQGPPGSPPVPAASTSNFSEDNGVTTSLGIPLTAHLTLSGYYNRSLRQHDDTVSTGITYVFRGTTTARKMSLIDRALREAEGVNK